MNKITFLIGTLLLSGCFLKPGENTQPVQKPATKGAAILEEWTALNPTRGKVETWANFAMQIVKKEAPKSRREANLARLSSKAERDAAGAVCSVEKVKIKIESDAVAAAGAMPLVSAGKVQIGPAAESTALDVNEDDDHFYQKGIASGISDGLYVLAAAGSDFVSPFREFLVVPGRLDDPRVNGSAFVEKHGVIKKGEGAVLEWNLPTFGTKGNILIVDILGAVDNENGVLVECADYESNYEKGDNILKWTLPPDYTVQLPTTTIGRIDFSRAAFVASRVTNPDLTLRGIRTSELALWIGE
ncbi:MAG: hypothetical protein HYZ71_09790 [Deltaproteobacteria bacterium]|nr:hypothetical protein [Deltaproteobacteria bacterium]